ncbi:MAG: cupredoxin domain-containing protein [Jatrophihabitantaceae bacterium]
MNRTTIAIAATLTAGGVLLAGCSSSSSPRTQAPPKSPSATSSAASTGTTSGASTAPTTKTATTITTITTITIKNFGYTVSGPAAPGTKISVTNRDDTAHTVTADTGKTFDVTIQPGKTEMITAPMKPGTYKFHCTFHAEMHGTITVSG